METRALIFAGTVPAIGQQVVLPVYGDDCQTKAPKPSKPLTRHWVVTDGAGLIYLGVKGPGVVGKQPTLAPGESFEYTSGWPLPAPFGVLQGTYQVITELGECFDALGCPRGASSEPVHGALTAGRS